MDNLEQDISDEIRATITRAMTHSDRSQHSAAKKLGISNIGHCRRHTQFMIDNVPFSDEQNNYQAAFNGTAIGDMIEKNLPYETQGEVTVTIPMRDGYQLRLVGHPDILVRDDNGKAIKVWDLKSKSGLDVVRKYGTPQNNIWQVTAYGKALIDAGEADPETLELALIYVDRSGDDPQPYVKRWTWSEEDWNAIVDWLDDVIEAMVTNSEAPKDMPRESFCQKWCFGGETEIITEDGLRRLEDLEGQTVKVLAPNSLEGSGSTAGKWVDAKVRSYGVQSLRTITLGRGAKTRKVIRATGNHQWPVAKGVTLTTDELRPGQRLRSITPAGRSFNFVPAGAQQGFTYGDGTRSMVPIYGNSTKVPLVDTLFSNHEVTRTPDVEGGRGGERYTVTGVPRHWNDLLGDLSKYDRSFLMSWLAGYFAADGTIAKGGQMTMSSAKAESLEQVRDVCAVLGVRVGQRQTHSRVGFGDVESDLHVMTIQSRNLLPDWFFLNPFHRERVEKVGPQKNHYEWKVISVEDHGEVEEVYCAEVPEIEHFALADFILTHNCEYASTCWAGDTDVTGLLNQEQYVTALEAYLEGGRLEREGKSLKKSAQSELKGVVGNVPTSQGIKSMRWIDVPGGDVSFTRQPYQRLSITKVPGQ